MVALATRALAIRYLIVRGALASLDEVFPESTPIKTVCSNMIIKADVYVYPRANRRSLSIWCGLFCGFCHRKTASRRKRRFTPSTVFLGSFRVILSDELLTGRATHLID